MSEEIWNLEYCLAKQVPDMSRGFTIDTNYGSIYIRSSHAPEIAELVRQTLEKELAELKRS